jgi:hypothetical protein
VPAQRREVEPEADDEEEEENADLAQRLEREEPVGREERALRGGGDGAEEGRPEEQPGDDLSDRARLPHARGERAGQAAEREDGEELREEEGWIEWGHDAARVEDDSPAAARALAS